MERHRCIGFDRIIDTDVAIRGTLRPADEPLPGPAIRVRWHTPGAAPCDAVPVWSTIDGALCFAPPGVARYLCTGNSIEVMPLADGARDMIDALLIATALPAILWLQGGFVLHAAAVVPRGEDGALAIAGPSGSGKSRLTAAFLAAGAALVADDSLVVEADRDGTACAGLAGGYHLGADEAGVRAFHLVADGRTRRSAPLRAIVILDRDPRPPSRSSLPIPDALRALLINRHRPNALRYGGLEPQSLGDAIGLARAVPVHRWPGCGADALLDGELRGAVIAHRAGVA